MATFKGNCNHCGAENRVGQYSINAKCTVCNASLVKKPKVSPGVSFKPEGEEVEIELPVGKGNKKLVA